MNKRTKQPKQSMPEGAAVIMHRAGRVWLCLREKCDSQNGLWSVPGGTIEPGETPVQAALRELEEETGIVYSTARSLGSSEHTKRVGRRTVKYRTYWFHIVTEKKPEHTEDKHSGWVSVDMKCCKHLKMMPGTQVLITALYKLIYDR